MNRNEKITAYRITGKGFVGIEMIETTRGEMEEHNARIDRHNARVLAKRAQVKRANNEKRIAREKAEIQAAMCDQCFTVHAGECY